MVVGAIRPDAEGASLRRSSMFDVALIGFFVVGGSLAPYALAASGISRDALWRIASLGLFACWSVGFVAAARRFRRGHGTTFLTPLWGPTIAVANALVVALGNGLLLWNVFFPGDGAAAARYIIALLGLLLLTAFVILTAVFADTK